MYALINANITSILESIAAFKRRDYHADEYAWLRNNLARWPDDFQERYSAYWGVTPFGLTPAAIVRPLYFCLLRATGRHGTHPVSYAAVMYALHGAGGKVEASFASKLCHMLAPATPIYDRHVAEFFLLAKLPASAPVPDRIARFVAFQGFLEAEYARVIAGGDLAPAMAAFRRTFAPAQSSFTDQKIIDSLIWGANRMMAPVAGGHGRGGLTGSVVAALPVAEVTIYPYLSLPPAPTPRDMDEALRRIRAGILKRQSQQGCGTPLKVRKIVLRHAPQGLPVPDWFTKWGRQRGIEVVLAG